MRREKVGGGGWRQEARGREGMTEGVGEAEREEELVGEVREEGGGRVGARVVGMVSAVGKKGGRNEG